MQVSLDNEGTTPASEPVAARIEAPTVIDDNLPMTDNHNYNLPEEGATNWDVPLNENFAKLDRDVEVRDQATSREQYEPKQGAKFFAIDTGVSYLGTGTDWQRIPTPTSSDGSLSTERPLVSTGSVSITVNENGGSDYRSIQAAIDNELPWLIKHEVDIRINDGSYDEDIVVPPYLANWAEPTSEGERVPIQITGDRGDPSSVRVGSAMATGGVGVLQLRGMTFTRENPWDNERSAVSSYNTYRVDIVDCRIRGSENAMIAYNGELAGVRVDVGDNDIPGWGIKVKNGGRYWEFGGGTTGTVGGPAFEMDRGEIYFNHTNDGSMTGNPTVNASNSSDGGFVFDEGNSRLYGPNRLAVKDIGNGEMQEIVVRNGSVEARSI